MTDAPKLKPCPFCGGSAHHFTSHGDSDSQEIVQCRMCGAEIGFWLPWTADGKEKASAEESVIGRWNTRADRIDMDVLARVEAALETGRLFIGGDVAEDGGLEMCDIGLRTDFEAASTALTDLRAMMEALK